MATDLELANTYREHANFMRELAAREKDAAQRARLIELSETFDRLCLKYMGDGDPRSG